jgi:hypothetical protein
MVYRFNAKENPNSHYLQYLHSNQHVDGEKSTYSKQNLFFHQKNDIPWNETSLCQFHQQFMSAFAPIFLHQKKFKHGT